MEILTVDNITNLGFELKNYDEADVLRFEKDQLQIVFVNYEEHKSILFNFKQGYFKDTDKGCVACSGYINLFAKKEVSYDDFKVFDSLVNTIKTLKS